MGLKNLLKKKEKRKLKRIFLVFDIDQKTQIKVNEEIELKANVTDIDGKPAAKTKVHFVNSNTGIVEFIDVTDKDVADIITTDSGIANIKIKWVKEGSSTITVSYKIVLDNEEKETSNNIALKVT